MRIKVLNEHYGSYEGTYSVELVPEGHPFYDIVEPEMIRWGSFISSIEVFEVPDRELQSNPDIYTNKEGLLACSYRKDLVEKWREKGYKIAEKRTDNMYIRRLEAKAIWMKDGQLMIK